MNDIINTYKNGIASIEENYRKGQISLEERYHLIALRTVELHVQLFRYWENN
jgi:hypothetical protein